MECMFQVNRSQSLFLSSNSCGPWETAPKGWSDNSDQYKQGPLTSRGRSRGARPILANGQRSLEAGDACRPGTTRGPLNSDASLVEVGLKAPNRVLPFCRPFPKMMVETAEAWRFTNNQVALVAWREVLDVLGSCLRTRKREEEENNASSAEAIAVTHALHQVVLPRLHPPVPRPGLVHLSSVSPASVQRPAIASHHHPGRQPSRGRLTSNLNPSIPSKHSSLKPPSSKSFPLPPKPEISRLRPASITPTSATPYSLTTNPLCSFGTPSFAPTVWVLLPKDLVPLADSEPDLDFDSEAQLTITAAMY